MRYPLLDKTNVVVNVTEMEIADAEKWKPPAGLTLGPASATADAGDTFDGKDYVRPAPPPKPDATTFRARDLVSLFTPQDFDAITKAAGGSAQIGLWLAMLYSRGEKLIDMNGQTFPQAWGALVQVLGQPRADELLAALKGAAS